MKFHLSHRVLGVLCTFIDFSFLSKFYYFFLPAFNALLDFQFQRAHLKGGVGSESRHSWSVGALQCAQSQRGKAQGPQCSQGARMPVLIFRF